MFSPVLCHFTDFYTFLSRFSSNQTGNPEIVHISQGCEMSEMSEMYAADNFLSAPRTLKSETGGPEEARGEN